MNKKSIIILFIMISTTIIATYFIFFKKNSCTQIEEYIASRDRQAIIELFKANWWWLIASPDFSTEFMLDHKAPDRNPLYMGKLKFKVLRLDNNLVGFTASYIKKKDLGRILFLVIDERYRGKGYADIMMKCTIADLQKSGAKRIILLTRESNIRAQKLYLRLGFEQYKYDPQGFVHFEYFP